MVGGAERPMPRPAGAPKPGPGASCKPEKGKVSYGATGRRGGAGRRTLARPLSSETGGGPSTAVRAQSQFSHAGSQRSVACEARVVARKLTAEGDDRLSTEDDEPERALHLVLLVVVLVLLGLGAALALDAAELVALCEHEVHVLVEREELPDERARVVEHDAHAVLQDRLHLGLRRACGSA